MIQNFIEKTLKTVLIVGGLGTAAAGLYAFSPQFTVENIAGIEYLADYTIFVRHWGFTVGLIGTMMVAAAFRPIWVLPVLIIVAVEKAFIVYLTVSNLGESFAAGFRVPAAMDSVIGNIFLLRRYSSIKMLVMIRNIHDRIPVPGRYKCCEATM